MDLESPQPIAVSWAQETGYYLTWCQNDFISNHNHPCLRFNGKKWINEWQGKAPINAIRYEHIFLKGRHSFIDYDVRDDGPAGRWRVIRDNGKGRLKLLFRLRTLEGSRSISSWHADDGRNWCAAVANSKMNANVVVDRLDRNGERSHRVLGNVETRIGDLACRNNSKFGWCQLAWTNEVSGQLHLFMAARTPKHWLPVVDLGVLTKKHDELENDIWLTGPNDQGRMDVAWLSEGELRSSNFDPASGWAKPVVHDQGVKQVDWSENKAGQRVLVWQNFLEVP